MSRIDELILHHTRRMHEAAVEIARIEKLPEGRHTTHEDHDKWIKGWEEDRRVCRDTVAYLETLKKQRAQKQTRKQHE